LKERDLRALFVDANDTLAANTDKLLRSQNLPVRVNRNPNIKPDDLPNLLEDFEIAIIDHTALPTAVAAKCARLKHVVFLGSGARSYMNPEELEAQGVAVHSIKGYGDTAVAECAIALMWACARNFGEMDRAMRGGQWLRRDSVQITGKTFGLIGFGGIAVEAARLALGCGMNVLAWNRTPKTSPGVTFVPLEQLLAQSRGQVSKASSRVRDLLADDTAYRIYAPPRIAGIRSQGAIALGLVARFRLAEPTFYEQSQSAEFDSQPSFMIELTNEQEARESGFRLMSEALRLCPPSRLPRLCGRRTSLRASSSAKAT
jgi:D-isomer specific 2-hydroxyacid dehydrogenase, NAD binding domain